MRKLIALAMLAAFSMQPVLADDQGGALSDGEIRKVDRDAQKITIKHGPLKSLDMPPMTMVFRVKNATLLDAVKPGDKVKFSAEHVGGQYVVTRIEAVK